MVGDAQGQDTRPLTLWRGVRTFLAAQLLPVPLMLLFINLLLFFGGLIDGEVALPPPPATTSAVRFTEGLFVLVAAYGVHGRFFAKRPKGEAAPQTTGGASLLTMGFVIHLGFLFSTLLVATPEKTYSAGVHQTFGPCGVPAVDLNGLRRNQYICAAENTQPFSLNCSDIVLPASVAAAPSGTVDEIRPKNSPVSSHAIYPWLVISGSSLTDCLW